jgi:hypothetical protein
LLYFVHRDKVVGNLCAFFVRRFFHDRSKNIVIERMTKGEAIDAKYYILGQMDIDSAIDVSRLTSYLIR